MVTCAGGYTAAGDTETTLTCVLNPELQSLLLEGSAHSCELAPCDISTLMPPSIVIHDCPNTVFEESCTASCSYGNAAITGTAAFTVLACDSEGALVCDPTLPYPTCEALTCSTGDFMPNGSLSGLNCASCRDLRDLRGRVPSGERNQWHFDVCVYNEVAGGVVLEVGGTEVFVGGLFS